MSWSMHPRADAMGRCADDPLDGFHVVAGEKAAQVLGETLAVRAEVFELAQAAVKAGRAVQLRGRLQAGGEILGKRDHARGPRRVAAGLPARCAATSKRHVQQAGDAGVDLLRRETASPRTRRSRRRGSAPARRRARRPTSRRRGPRRAATPARSAASSRVPSTPGRRRSMKTMSGRQLAHRLRAPRRSSPRPPSRIRPCRASSTAPCGSRRCRRRPAREPADPARAGTASAGMRRRRDRRWRRRQVRA